ncbi:MAG: hypothetical protein HXY28_13065 [Hydrogenophilaceae bacterium]|nr:hypothetical protein [Hydrogenophilaceae bacterium]
MRLALPAAALAALALAACGQSTTTTEATTQPEAAPAAAEARPSGPRVEVVSRRQLEQAQAGSEGGSSEKDAG